MIYRALLLIAVINLFCLAGTDMMIHRVIDTFSTCVASNGVTPCGWYSTQNNIAMFSLVNERGNQFVRIKTYGGNTTIGVKACFNPEEYPYLSWRWRVFTLPAGGTENVRSRSDSGGGVYVIFHGTMRLNRIIKYVWSATLKKGCVTESPFNSRTKIVVLESANSDNNIGTWIDEKVNILEDYKKNFNAPPVLVDAIAIMTDADNTKSVAEADYDDFWISKEK
jgi:hypothetical protein